jgi:ATP-dependent DNA helicase PIF1
MTQGEALTILKTGANAFLTGEPGSGKTHTINAYISWLRDSGIEPSITAATGIAATHVGGMTIHSWSGIGVSSHLSPAEIDRIASKEHVARRVAKAKVLVIDEISMLSSDTFGGVDAICKEIRRNPAPFGGLQVILVGDFFQLPPVQKSGTTSFAYEATVWRDLNPLICYLTEQHRQDDDAFVEVLSAIRRGDVEELHYERLVARGGLQDGAPKGAPHLYAHNADVDRINAEELAKLPTKSRKFLMSSTGRESFIDGLKRGCLSPEVLELKEGAQVMFTKNSPQGNFVNGTLGVVLEFDGYGMPVVHTKSGEYVTAERMEWQVEEDGKIRASITQVPLRLAYAMTVHKSQGMSMDAAVIDLSRAFEYGQGYVALSRVRRLSGLYLLGVNDRALQVHPAILEKDHEFRAASSAAAATFAGMNDGEVVEMQKRFVKAVGGAWQAGGSKSGSKKKSKAFGNRLAATLQSVRDSKTLAEAAKTRGLAQSTIVTHLEELAKNGELVRSDYTHLLPKGMADIKAAVEAVGGEKLTPIFTYLKGRYSFEDIRLARITLT